MAYRSFLTAAMGACFVLLTGASEPASTEANVLDEINWVRANPADYAAELREYRRFIDGRILRLPGDPNGAYTREGAYSVDEAIDFLERQAPLPPLSEADLLSMAARDHAYEQGYDGGSGHLSRDGASPGERVRRRGGGTIVGEAIAYGENDPRAVVRSLVIDDGVPDRGHRKLLFDPGYRFAGVGCGEHRRYRAMCVIDLAGTQNGDPPLPAGAKGAAVFIYRGPARPH